MGLPAKEDRQHMFKARKADKEETMAMFRVGRQEGQPSKNIVEMIVEAVLFEE